MGVPRRGRYCLGMLAPMRLPTPPASRTRETLPFSTVAAATHRIARRPVVLRRRLAEERERAGVASLAECVTAAIIVVWSRIYCVCCWRLRYARRCAQLRERIGGYLAYSDQRTTRVSRGCCGACEGALRCGNASRPRPVRVQLAKSISGSPKLSKDRNQ